MKNYTTGQKSAITDLFAELVTTPQPRYENVSNAPKKASECQHCIDGGYTYSWEYRRLCELKHWTSLYRTRGYDRFWSNNRDFIIRSRGQKAFDELEMELYEYMKNNPA